MRGCVQSFHRSGKASHVSQHALRCVSLNRLFSWHRQVFPAYAWMISRFCLLFRGRYSLPRICVDDLWNLTEAYCSIVHPRIRGEYSPSLQRTGKSKVHPRMRGEDEFIVPYSRPAIGSPPRSRGIFIDNLESLLAARFTPAFAGNIFHWLLPLHSSGVHPRVRGEYSRIIRLLEAKTKNQLAFYRPVYS